MPRRSARSRACRRRSTGGSRALVLADPRRLEAEQDAIETWLRGGGSAQAVLVAVADPADGDEVLRRFPFVDDLLLRAGHPGAGCAASSSGPSTPSATAA